MIQIRNPIIIFLLIFLYNCGYSPVYNNSKNNDIKLNITSISGDNSFNNQIKTYAKLYSNLNLFKNFLCFIISLLYGLIKK